jgi:hypothetical protein
LIRIAHVCDDFGVAHAFQRVKAETDFLAIFTRRKARATLVAAAAVGCYRSGSITFATILLQSFLNTKALLF